MKGAIFLVLMGVLQACDAWAGYVPKEGDILFQESPSSQSAAIQAATHSRYSHVGIVYIHDGKPYVYEAVGPVKETPLQAWIERGARRHFVAKRLRSADTLLTKGAIEKMKAVGGAFSGRPYDLTFEWSDDRIYCSELVWKIYNRAIGVDVGRLQKLREFDLDHPAVRGKVEERYGGKIPLDETVISPASMFDSTELESVYEQ
jgi:uncharacterized protein YycO